MARPILLAWLTLSVLALMTLPSRSERLRAASGWPDMTLQPVSQGLENPVQATHAGDGSGRLFVVEQPGRVRIVQGGVLLAQPFLDITDLVHYGGEEGLLSIAFAPQYASTGRFYVAYTDASLFTHVVRYRVSATDPQRAEPASAEPVITIQRDGPYHNGGQLAFGADGMLYISTGDGGAGGGDPYNRAQDGGSLLGKLLRLNVEQGAPVSYTIPPDNPFVSDPSVLDEVWALGLRNPWRFAFDPDTDELFVADVGQNLYEEINWQPASSGGGHNYGWRCYEATHPFNLSGCANASAYTSPIWEYDHSAGRCSITGGPVVRGSVLPALDGVYLYADFCTGELWGLAGAGAQVSNARLLDSDVMVTSIGSDEAGQVYVTGHGTSSTTTLWKLAQVTTATPTVTAAPPTSTATSAPPSATATHALPTGTAPAPSASATAPRSPTLLLPLLLR